jgi:hypothetical protein
VCCFVIVFGCIYFTLLCRLQLFCRPLLTETEHSENTLTSVMFQQLMC